ncbi:hypothetical protein BKA82DRAFT_148551, partial [Pisolithus tinctorius]
EETNIQPVSTPVTTCADLHSWIWDLLELLRKGGSVPETSYIFMARRCPCAPASADISTTATYARSRYVD